MSAVSDGYRLDPGDAGSILAAVQAEPLARNGVLDALDAALEALGNVDDPLTDDIIYTLSGISGDVGDSPARIDARIAVAIDAAQRVIGAIVAGDDEAGRGIETSRSTADLDAARFRGRPR